MNKFIRFSAGIVIIIAAWRLFGYQADRLYVYAEPQEGELNGIVLMHQQNYEQSVIYERASISRLGIYLRSTVAELPPGDIALNISQSGKTLANSSINSAALDNEGSAQWRFKPPLMIDSNQPVKLKVSISSLLSGSIRAQKTIWANNEDASLTVDGRKQNTPLAFSIYDFYRPPLAYQGAIVLLGLALLLLLPLFNIQTSQRFSLMAGITALTLIYISPAALSGRFSLTALSAFLVALTGMLTLLGSLSLPPAAAWLGAGAFALTTWWPLQLMAGRGQLLLAAVLPLLCMLLIRFRYLSSKNKAVIIFSLLVYVFISLALFSWTSPHPRPVMAASLKDIFLDPNQTPGATKIDDQYLTLDMPSDDPSVVVQNGGWHHFGSYLGVINIALAIAGIVFYGRKYKLIFLVGVISYIVAASPLTNILSSLFALPPQYAIIGLTFALAFFTANGLNRLWQFLGRDYPVSFIIHSLVILTLLDMLNVVTKTWEFSLL